VHAATFLLVGVFWMLHHGALARVVEVNTRTLTLNLLTLFWITLLPYGAKNAAERPLEPLGASLISACCGFHQCQYDNQFYPSAPTYVPLPGFLEIDNGSAGCH